MAYLTLFLETDRGIGCATHSLAKFHAETHPEHRVFLYILKPPDDGVKQFHENSNVHLRFIKNVSEEFTAQLDEDGIDVVLADNFFWITVCVLAVRIAPIQILLDMTHVYGNLPEVDWWFIGSGDYRRHRGLPCSNASALPFDRIETTVRSPVAPETAKARASLGDAPAIGFIGRLIKFTDDMQDLAREILNRNPDAMLLVCGPGDPTPMRNLMKDEKIGGRVRLINEYVDVATLGRAIDVFLDSHPFTGGETCREVMSYGVPVVTFQNPDFAPLIEVGRDPELVVADRDEYIKTVSGLLDDSDFRLKKSEAAKEIAARRGDMSLNVESIVAKIDELMKQLRERNSGS